MFSESELNRLRWLCTHRSMREMDVLLGDFFETRFIDLEASLQAAFVHLAEQQDIELWPLLSGRRESASPTEAALVRLLREARK